MLIGFEVFLVIGAAAILAQVVTYKKSHQA